jgi:hypothetical protein
MSILKEANTIIYGDREKTYGHPSKNLVTIALMWNAYLNAKANKDTLGPKDVAAMMVLLKTARLANNPEHRDSLVDICGYAALIERCDEAPAVQGEEE